jgi:hypothetical protein
MANELEIVTTLPLARATLPEWSRVGVGLLVDLVRRGVWEKLAEQLRVQRSGGYSGIDAVLFLLLFFCAGGRGGLKGFGTRAAASGEALAALGGRSSLVTQSTISRLLQAAEEQHVRRLGPLLLWEATDAVQVAGHSAMQTCDARGESWHIVDYDLTKTVLRKRGLPEGEDLPPARRYTDGFAAPGYPGHKRGEVQVSRATLQHAGSGLWLDARLNPGNGDGLASLASAVEVTGRIATTLAHPRTRVLMRMDGEFGNVPALTVLQEAGQPGLTRLNRLHLLDQAEVRARIGTGTWYRVPDSACGPVRSALDLGTVTLRPGRDVQRADGSSYEPLDVRVIISRLPREGAAEHGRVIDGWQYELFAGVLLPAEAWPAHEAVAAYFGRGGQENRFAQEDRELALDRIFSYNLAGQELACLVGLMVWNLHIVHGVACAPPLPKREPAPFAPPVVDDRPVPSATWSPPAETPPPPKAEASPPPTVPDDPAADLARVLAEIPWAEKLATREGWTWDDAARVLRCPDGHPTTLTHVHPDKGGKCRQIMLRAPAHVCRTCPLRATCLSSARTDQTKIATFAVASEVAQRLATILPAVQFAGRKQRSSAALLAPSRSGRAPRPVSGSPLPIQGATDSAPGPHKVSHAPFLPAAARHALRRVLEGVDFQVDLRRAASPRQHPFIARTPDKRQHRRATWQQRLSWYALPEGSSVRVRVHGGAQLTTVFPWVSNGEGCKASTRAAK